MYVCNLTHQDGMFSKTGRFISHIQLVKSQEKRFGNGSEENLLFITFKADQLPVELVRKSSRFPFGATLHKRCHPVGGCDALRCTTKLLPKKVSGKAKTCCPAGKALNAALCSALMQKSHPVLVKVPRPRRPGLSL